MSSIVKVLEKMGQQSSLNQFNSVNEMLDEMNVKSELLHEVFKKSEEFICLVQPEDDE